jgi:prophage regulatory protein
MQHVSSKGIKTQVTSRKRRRQQRHRLRILRIAAVCDRVGVSKTTIWRLERRGQFPKHLSISPGAIGWLEADIERWISARVETR